MILEDAVACVKSGWAITPLSGKIPVLKGWSKREYPSIPDVYTWFDGEYQAFGIRCGTISGNLLVIDVEGDLMGDGERLAKIGAEANRLGVAPLLREAWETSASTPSGGRHLFIQCPTSPFPRNAKLAYRAGVGGFTLLAEIRGEGGQVAAPGVEGRAFEKNGGWGVAVPVEAAELAAILAAFKSVDESQPVVKKSQPRGLPQFATAKRDSIADILSDALLRGEMRWEHLLDPGWTFVGWDSEGRSRWLRPDYGCKPTSLDSAHGFENYAALPSPVLVVHSAGVPHLPAGSGTRLTPGRVLAACWWAGDEAEMYRDLEAGTHPDGLNLPADLVADIQDFANRRIQKMRAATTTQAQEQEQGGALAEYERDVRRATYGSLVSIEGRDRAMRILAGQGVEMPTAAADGAAYLALPDEETDWALPGLLPAFGNATLTASFKSGKTTVMGDLVRAVCDGQPFLGRFNPAPLTGTIALWNYELSSANQRRWLRDLRIENPNKMHVLDLRGHRWPFVNERVEDLTVEWLAERQVEWWIIDPFARAFVGCGDENSNVDVSTWTDTLDVIKRKSGVKQVVMPVHTGRPSLGGNADVRARGATRLDDWADVRWLLVRDEQTGARFFRAHGRDVDLDEEELQMDPATRRLKMAGWDRHQHRIRTFTAAAVRAVTDAGPAGMSRTELAAALPDMPRPEVKRAIDSAVASRLLDENGGILTAVFGKVGL